MSDPDIEDFVRKFRPVGPPPRLRERVATKEHIRRIWPWMAAAAALLVTAAALDVATGAEARRANVRLDADIPVTDELAARLGDGAHARELAEVIVIEQKVRSEIAGMAATAAEVPRGEQP